MSSEAKRLERCLGNPGALADARIMAHAAIQVIAKAGRANLGMAEDGSDMSLTWALDVEMFLTHSLEPQGESLQLGISLDPLRLVFVREGISTAELRLDGVRLVDAEAWRDEQLASNGLTTARDVTVLYDLPEAVLGVDHLDGTYPGLPQLAAWYSLAGESLQQIAAAYAAVEPGPSPVRLWPHHFDIATYISFERGDPETARGIGVGLSPGDASYAQPYFYVTPWPPVDASSVPLPISPGNWHVDGFVGFVATGHEVLSEPDVKAAAMRFLSKSVKAGWQLLNTD